MSVSVSVVAPIYNEAEVVAELVRRIDAACRSLGDPYEVIIADDCSTDGTDLLLAGLVASGAFPALRHERLPENAGQWGATAYGLARARGDVIVTIDGDLQDPPEIIPELVAKLRATADADVCFACKTGRDDPLWFIIGMRAFRLVQDTLAAASLPAGAGAYVAIRRPTALRAAAIRRRMVNLAPVLVALGAQPTSVPYEKLARYDGQSRVGPLGLVDEAFGSLVITGAMQRLLWLLATGGAVSFAVGGGPAAAIATIVLVAAGLWSMNARQDALAGSNEGSGA